MSSSASNCSPLLVVVSAPSGAGKSTLCGKLLAEQESFVYSVSCTTRDRRGKEVHGKDYYFLTQDEFDARVAEGHFLEHAVVYGHSYGTLKETVADALSNGSSVLMDIDVQGAGQIRDSLAGAAEGDPLRAAFVDVFILPPSVAVLKARLESRNEDEPGAIAGRLDAAQKELAAADDYKYTVVNEDIEKAYSELVGIVDREQTIRSR